MDQLEYPYFNGKIPVENLILDNENPRLPDYIQGKDESEIISHMLIEESTLELMQAIGQKGFFPGEQLLVVPIGDDKYKVIEGNRRLTAVKLLNNPELATVQRSLVDKIRTSINITLPISFLPCMVFEKDENIHDYLGYRHVTGIQPWNLRQKAKYVSYLREKNYSELSLDQASNELRKIIGSKKDYVKRLLTGHKIYTLIRDNAFFKIKGLDEEGLYFSYIADSLSRSNISNYLNVDLDLNDPIEKINLESLKNWTSWLFEPIDGSDKYLKSTRLKGKSQDLNMLNSILGNEKAKKEFIVNNATLEEAHTYTGEEDNLFTNSIAESLMSLKKANSLIYKIDEFYPSLDDDLREIIKVARTIKSVKDELIKNEFDGDEFGR
ncbi:ParB/Srx family N-terminal domain-containing protein [Chryseobacterium sp. VAUSW3]|uniref:ParB/Srx family N-terminal domain-containing protein n=1 Tax=Chryseobacterium sp. VAUSW3 TaxID=2010998 RepID=UPI000B4C5DCD|nr:ParB/Srx family N-terminal domain-containing protein [Chryseobacterium sp. VAUSW3]OWR13760.1 hypothetical protein CDW55_05265 [Chryseobacterium sp. VAUSW3]